MWCRRVAGSHCRALSFGQIPSLPTLCRDLFSSRRQVGRFFWRRSGISPASFPDRVLSTILSCLGSAFNCVFCSRVVSFCQYRVIGGQDRLLQMTLVAMLDGATQLNCRSYFPRTRYSLSSVLILYFQTYPFSGISGNLETSEILAKVSVKSGKDWAICVVIEIWLWQLNKMLVTELFSDRHIAYYLYFILTVIHSWCSRRIWINKCSFVRHIACNFV